MRGPTVRPPSPQPPRWPLRAHRLPVPDDIYAAHGRDERARARRELAAQADTFTDGYDPDLLHGLDELDVAWSLYDWSGELAL
jgi:hypothetical protein